MSRLFRFLPRTTPLLAGVLLLVMGGQVEAQERQDLRLNYIQVDMTVEADGTYVSTLSQEIEVLTPYGRNGAGQTGFTYHPDSQTMEVLEAAVIQPDGSRTDVAGDSIIVRPSAVAQRSAGFSKEMAVTVLFPDVHVGSRTILKARRTVFKPSPVGINVVLLAPSQTPVERYEVNIDVPMDFPFQTGHLGKWDVEDTTTDGRRRIKAVLTDDIQLKSEPGTPDRIDFAPQFVASSLTSWEAVGTAYRQQAADKAVPTPEIAALTRQIVGDRMGEDAVRIVYAWIVANIRYVQVYLDPHAGYVPNPAPLILERRFGDCKDYVTLMQAMLASIGIRSEAVLVSWGNRHGIYPIPTAFQFNHAMIHVPDFGIWANPTDVLAPMGIMDDGLADKFVVVAAEQPSTARLPLPTADENFHREVTTITLGPDGTIRGTGRVTAGGSLDQRLRRRFDTWKPTREMADDILLKNAYGGFGDMRPTPARELDTPMTVEKEWESPQAVRMDDSILFHFDEGLPLTSLSIGGLQTRGTRDFPFSARYGRRTKEIEFILPDGYVLDRFPKNVSVANETGSYAASYKAEGGRVLIRRELILLRPVYGAGQHNAFMELAVAARHDAGEALLLRRLR